MNRKLVSKSNLVLRRVLNSNEQMDILRDFIESILKLEIKKISLNPYLKTREKYLPEEENFGVADVRILTKDEKELNVGIQFIDGLFVQNKLLLYYAQIHTNQMEQRAKQKIVQTITINILDFNFFNTKECHKVIKIKDKENENVELHVIELPKFKTKKELTKEEAWISYLSGRETKDMLKKFDKIEKLDYLLNEYWKEEKME